MREHADHGSKKGPEAGTVAAAVLGLLVVAFVFSNTRRTEIRFIGPEVETPIWLALALPLLLGVVIGWLLAKREDRRDGGLD